LSETPVRALLLYPLQTGKKSSDGSSWADSLASADVLLDTALIAAYNRCETYCG
jgi:hypothetical protein